MPVNTAVHALVLIFIPGILCYGVVASLASKRTRDNTTVLLQIFMYGVVSYMALAACNYMSPSATAKLGIDLADIALLNPSSVDKSGIKPTPIAAASVIGLCLGVLITVNVNASLLERFCRLIRLNALLSAHQTDKAI
jgi:hypothetical protein